MNRDGNPNNSWNRDMMEQFFWWDPFFENSLPNNNWKKDW
jgi:hypothetical protein